MRYTFKTVDRVLVVILAMFAVGMMFGCEAGGMIKFGDQISEEIPEVPGDGEEQAPETGFMLEAEVLQDCTDLIDGSEDLRISFGDDAIDPASLYDDDGKLRLSVNANCDDSERQINRVKLEDDNSILRAAIPLKNNCDHTLTIKSGVSTISGETSSEDETLTFTTAPNKHDLLGNGYRATLPWSDASTGIIYAIAGENFTGERDPVMGYVIPHELDDLFALSWSYGGLGIFASGMVNLRNSGDAAAMIMSSETETEYVGYAYDLSDGFTVQFQPPSPLRYHDLLAVKSLEDMNGDCLNDFAIIEYELVEEDGGEQLTPYFSTRVFYTRSDFASASSTEDADAVIRNIGAEALDVLALLVTSGDVNGDGLNDLLTFGMSPELDDGKAVLNIYFNSAGGISLDPSVVIETSPGWTFTGVKVGDINGDEIDDIVISMVGDPPMGTGRIAVLLGSTDLASSIIVPSGEVFTNIFCETPVDDGSCGNNPRGFEVSDFNRDGYDDILIGAPYGMYGAGIIVLFYGAESMPNSYFYEADLFFISTFDTCEKFGMSVEKVGDINDDGYPDFLTNCADTNIFGTTWRYFLFKGEYGRMNEVLTRYNNAVGQINDTFVILP